MLVSCLLQPPPASAWHSVPLATTTGCVSLLAIAALFGAPAFSAGTLSWLAGQTCTLALPMAVHLCRTASEGAEHSMLVRAWLLLCSPHAWLAEAPMVVPGVAALLGAWLGAFAAPLDWGQAWQAWPVASWYSFLALYCCGWLAVACRTAGGSGCGACRRPMSPP